MKINDQNDPPGAAVTVDVLPHAQVKRWPSKVGPYRVTRTMGSTVSAVLSSAFKLQVGGRWWEATRWLALGVAPWMVVDD